MKKIRLILFALLLLLAILILIFQNTISTEDGLNITYRDSEYQLSINEISDLDIHYIQTARGSNHQAFSLEEVLDLAGIAQQEIERISIASIDGMRLTVNKTELDDLNLELDKVSGTFRLIIPPDRFAQRWLKNVNTIAVQ